MKTIVIFTILRHTIHSCYMNFQNKLSNSYIIMAVKLTLKSVLRVFLKGAVFS